VSRTIAGRERCLKSRALDLGNSALNSPFDDSSYYVWLSRLSEADWLMYLGRGPAAGGIEIKMRLFEKRSACPAIIWTNVATYPAITEGIINMLK